MIRKLLVVAAAIAMPVSIVAVSGGLAGASNPHTAASDSVSCTKITGTLTFSPKIDAAGYKTGKIATKVAATLTGCTATGSTHITITKGVASGTIDSSAGTTAKPTGKCTGLSGPGVEIGNLTVAWTASAGGPVPSSVLGVKSDSGASAGGHGVFTIPGATKSTASGSFVGTDHGAKDKSISETVLTSSSILSTCLHSGLSSLKIQAESGKAALTLG